MYMNEELIQEKLEEMLQQRFRSWTHRCIWLILI